MKMISVAADHGIAREDVCLPRPPFLCLSFVNTAVKETSGYQVLIVLLIYTYNWAIRLPTMHSGSLEAAAPCSPNAHPIASSPQSHSDKLVKNQRGTSCFLQLSWVSSQPSASHLRRSALWAAEVVSQHSVCCAHWNRGWLFPSHGPLALQAC